MNDAIKVYYPFGGKRLLLQWYTYDDRGHVVLSETKSGLHAVAERVFDENPNAEIKAMCEINVVGPSKLLNKLAAKASAAERVSVFYEEINCYLIEAVKDEVALPSPFALCTKYEPSEDVVSDDWATESHYNCKNCKSRIKLIGTTPDALYEKFHETWRVLHPAPVHIDPKRVTSRAAPAKDDASLWYAYANFGHHAKGVELFEVKLEDAECYRPGYFSNDLMFFFERIRDLDAKPLQALLNKKKKAAKKQQAEREKARGREYEQERRDRINKVLSLFTGRNP